MGRAVDLDERFMDFAVATGRVVLVLPTDRLGSHVAKQLIRCGTAPAANYAEAQAAESRRDFIHKLKIALKELRESLMWLRYAERVELVRAAAITPILDECDQLIAILVKSIRTARRNDEAQ